MNDLLKKGFLLGLGAAVASKEKVEKYFQDLVEKGKLTPKEAEELFDSLVKKGEETGERWNRRSKEKVRSMINDLELEVVSKDEFDELKQRVVALEKKINVDSTVTEKIQDELE
ncbi:phasin family protein [Evansella sp. AB-rgal1]|uniref:phasin family protein n=1 Tax=Evansella sp. AB-rgal1 TaxID=3242696 RepID=UPI00359CEE88